MPGSKEGGKILVYTVGHSNRPIDEFLKLLKRNLVTLVADIRSIPGSGYNPQYNSVTLAHTLRINGIGYVRLEDLGGYLSPARESPNDGLGDDHFRAYADYMLTDAFRRALEKFLDLARKETVAAMCSEAFPGRCHRQFFSDALVIRAVEVQDIYGLFDVRTHWLSSLAVVRGDTIIYPKDSHQTHLF